METQQAPNLFLTRWIALFLLTASGLFACSGGSAATGENGASIAAGMPPVEVKTIVSSPKPIPQTSDFIAIVRSLRSTVVQPEVEGIIRRIFVKAGDRVEAGQPLLQIDSEKQEAMVASLESTSAAREADLEYAHHRLERLRSLFEAGVVSEQDLELAETAQKTAEAQLRAVNAQIQENRVELQYYRLTAPTAGMVGDLEVREGDRITESTVVTTIDQPEGMEAYISVPLEEAPRLRIGLPVELLDRQGEVLASNNVTFISPRVDDATQTVLVKSLLLHKPEDMRVLQYVRARIVWSKDARIAVPVMSVLRLSGQRFVFTAEEQENGEFLARQKPVQLGPVVNEEYIVEGGLVVGDRLIVSNLQQLRDGVPVRLDE